MLELTCRIADATDASAMGRLRDVSGWPGGASAERMALYLEGRHHPQHAKAPRAAFLAELGDELVGFVAGHLTSRFGCSGEIQWILVAPSHRGGPAATMLLRRLSGWFVEQGAARVCVNVEPENERARRFYHREGAVELSTYWLVWPDVASPS